MAQLALYRKYRSQTFEDLIGQDHVVKTLQSAISSGRMAQAYLFTGPRGTGKTSSARLLAKCLNCDHGPTPTPCNECEQCIAITNGSHVDVNEIDAASEAGVDNVREAIVEQVQYLPMMGKYKVFIIDEVHDLSAKAFDALLKTIEEPPPHLVFILATTEYNKVPPTIRSRCQKFEFHRATLQNLVDRLTYVVGQEGATAEPQAVAAIARMADGGYRDALTLLEQALLVSGGNIDLQTVYDQLGLVTEESVDKLLVAIQTGNVGGLVTLLDEIGRLGRDPRSILESLLHRLGDLTRAVYEVSADSKDSAREASMHDIAVRLGREFIVGIRAELSEAHKVIRDISLPKLWLESELVRLATVGLRSSAPIASAPAARRYEDPVPARAAVAAPAPASTPVAPSTPVSAPAHEAPAQSAVQPAVETMPTPAAGASGDIWQKLFGRIPDKTPSGGNTPIKLKLASAYLLEDLGEEIVVGIPQSMAYEWLMEDPRRSGYLQKILVELGRGEAQLRFELKKKLSS